jgi:hypothetical protein
MSWWSRIVNVVRGDRLRREIDEEIDSHIAEAVELGRDPAGARRAFGSALRHREESRDIRLMPWLDSLRADAVFGWRQILKRKVTSAAAILFSRAGDRFLRLGVPAHRRIVTAAAAGEESRAALRPDSPLHRIRWRAGQLRRVVVSRVPPDARGREG